jgi:hypothetical protein
MTPVEQLVLIAVSILGVFVFALGGSILMDHIARIDEDGPNWF